MSERTSAADDGDGRSKVRLAVEVAAEFHSSMNEQKVETLVDRMHGLDLDDLGTMLIARGSLDFKNGPSCDEATLCLLSLNWVCFVGLLMKVSKNMRIAANTIDYENTERQMMDLEAALLVAFGASEEYDEYEE